MPATAKLTTLAGVVVLLVSTTTTSVQAAEDEVRAARTIKSITAHITEDDWGADEPYIRYKHGAHIWGPGSLNDGETAAVDRRVHDGDTIEVWDDDYPDEDDKIGEVTISPRFKKYSFYGDDAMYSIWVE